jgi:fatty-acyl-CoA synthase
MSHPGVNLAACIAVAHPKWDERPLLIIEKKENATLTMHDLLALYEYNIARWWTPDEVLFVDAMPIGATGKC